MNERAAKLLEIARAAGEEEKAAELVEDIAFLEQRLQELRRLPFLRVDPNNPERQRPTLASRQYKELLQQYNNSLKLFRKLCGDLREEEAESPLRAWLKNREKNADKNGQ
jgi:hypothetical protein